MGVFFWDFGKTLHFLKMTGALPTSQFDDGIQIVVDAYLLQIRAVNGRKFSYLYFYYGNFWIDLAENRRGIVYVQFVYVVLYCVRCIIITNKSY